MNHPHPLAERWRNLADQLRAVNPGFADTLESFAAQLDDWEREHWLEELTVEQAARESGFAKETLYRQVETGGLVNRGSKGSPSIRRGDLGRKARLSS